MPLLKEGSFAKKAKNIFIGKELDPNDHTVFHRLSLIAFFAWVGLGADGLSSSCYGPQEAFLALGEHTFLAVFVAIGTALTIFIISAGYSQIIELFPHGGGGYIVASKLLSPQMGMVSGCALLIDYVLTITLSIASGADALFSFLPETWLRYKIIVAVLGVVLLTIMNMRGVKESIMALVPVFMVFIITHAIVIIYALVSHSSQIPALTARITADVSLAKSQLGLGGMALLVLRSYSMGAGTYTGIEAVSNGLQILREPREETGKRTMRYMAISLSITVAGLILAYLLFDVKFEPGKTLNASLFEIITSRWGSFGYGFMLVTLVSEALLLFVAAQAGFLDGPRVLSNMAIDRWFPARFALLSDRLVTQNGILLMGGASLILMLVSGGSVGWLIVLYSINVFVTFVLSQLGMVIHWWKERNIADHWKKGLVINGLGLLLTGFILVTVIMTKFFEGGWITILITGSLAFLALMIKKHYKETGQLLKKLDVIADATLEEIARKEKKGYEPKECEPKGRTAVVLVNGFNGLGLHTLMSVLKYDIAAFQNYIFIQIGVVDAAVFKGSEEIIHLNNKMDEDLGKYVRLMKARGFHSESMSIIGTDLVAEVMELTPQIIKKFPKAIFFGGQIVFREDSIFTRFLHNYAVFALQREFYKLGLPFMIMPILADKE